MYKGFTFDQNNDVANTLFKTINVSEGNIFSFNKTDKDNINRVNFQGKESRNIGLPARVGTPYF